MLKALPGNRPQEIQWHLEDEWRTDKGFGVRCAGRRSDYFWAAAGGGVGST